MKRAFLVLLVTGLAFGQNYPTYHKPKPKPSPELSMPAVNAANPSTYAPKGTLYTTGPGGTGQIREVTGPGQSVNAGTSLGRSTYSRTPGRGPPTVSAGSKVTTSKINRTPLGESYPGQQP